ncbi:copper resistance protein NlpE [Sphingobacterium bovistauri]|uniref:Copper resistance protein NlpE N-terminal domain-containing protein n=1 Tax=Sphingobacterium bovistauri TaxID=2781959 RepID=A0ABS7Z6H3_9SPHI|nr:copper resistance protein NlpE [Sphingobacterium bovistauri]MCA5005613.1 copper resistance protein NlpE N-terminal domain-containing protein [Sphingobacterium bovistauri]
MRWLISILSSIILIGAVFSCVNNQKTVAAKDSVQNMETLSANVAGMYSGNLPCVDCESISTLLELYKDNSYVLRYSYEGKSDDQFVKQGTWSITKNTLNLEGVDYQYEITPDFLVQLDLAGNEIKGDIAEKYQLSRIK